MNVEFLYTTALGKFLLKGLMHPKLLSVISAFLHSPVSKIMIRPVVRRYHIDMYDFRKQKFSCYADFFARKRDWVNCCGDENSLIAPCDGLLSVFPIKDVKGAARFRVKGSMYRICDLITDKEAAEKFLGGYCLIYRLEGSDYHHFCYIDDCYHGEGHMIPGTLHSVQPAACEKKPVFRMNRRMWSLMDTAHFGTVAQIEVGALLVGGIVHEKQNCKVERGDEMGHFELAGSTIIQFFTKDARDTLELLPKFQKVLKTGDEVRVKQGQVVGEIKG